MNTEQIQLSLEKIRASVSTVAQFPVVHMLTEIKIALKEIVLECSKIEKEVKGE